MPLCAQTSLHARQIIFHRRFHVNLLLNYGRVMHRLLPILALRQIQGACNALFSPPFCRAPQTMTQINGPFCAHACCCAKKPLRRKVLSVYTLCKSLLCQMVAIRRRRMYALFLLGSTCLTPVKYKCMTCEIGSSGWPLLFAQVHVGRRGRGPGRVVQGHTCRNLYTLDQDHNTGRAVQQAGSTRKEACWKRCV